MEIFYYTVEVCSVGTVDMLINSVEFNFNENLREIVGSVPENPVPAGQCTSLVPSLQIDVCSDASYLASVFVQATPPNGNTCEGEQQVLVSVSSLPPPPTMSPTSRPIPLPSLNPTLFSVTNPTPEPRLACDVDVRLQCRREDGSDCSTIEPRATNCLEPLFYTIEICNVGSVEMEITKLDILFNGQLNDLLLGVPQNPLDSLSCTSVSPRYEPSICGGNRFSVSVFVEANRLGGDVCDDSETTVVTVEPVSTISPTPAIRVVPTGPDINIATSPSSTPTSELAPQVAAPTKPPGMDCSMELSLSCVTEDGADCRTVETRANDCELRFLYSLQICSLGIDEFELIEAEFTINENSVSFLGEIENPILEQSCATANPAVDVNLCRVVDLDIFASVTYVMPNGNRCQESTQLAIMIAMLPSSPTLAPRLAVPTVDTPDNTGCVIDLELTCATENGLSCDAVRAPSSSSCDTETPLSQLQFSYQPSDCDQFANIQDTKTTCVDENTITEGQVEVLCLDGLGGQLVVTPALVFPNGSFTVRNQDQGILPERIECTLVSPGGTMLQTINFSTASSLELGTLFGSLRVEGCNTKSCRSIYIYDIATTNTGVVEMEVTRLELLFLGRLFSLIDLLAAGPLLPGQSASLQQTFEVDICSINSITAAVDVQADPPSGTVCQDVERIDVRTDTLVQPLFEPTAAPTILPFAPSATFPTNGPTSSALPDTADKCIVDIELLCTAEDGTSCSAIETLSSLSCTDDFPLSQILLSYQGSTCDQSTNTQGSDTTCVDENPLSNGQVETLCFDGIGTPLNVTPRAVSRNESFTVTRQDQNSLSGRIECIIVSMEGTVLQKNNFDISGGSSFQLGYSFGALRVDGCNEKACRSSISYESIIRNSGDVELDVSRFDFLFIDRVFVLVDSLQDNPLPVGQTTSVEQKFEIDICSGGSVIAAVEIQGNTRNGAACQAAAQSNVAISSLPLPSPVPPQPTSGICAFDLAFDCRIVGNEINSGKVCTAPDTGVVPCRERPTAATMLFNGGSCEQSDNRQFMMFTCNDRNGGPPSQQGEEAHILVTDAVGAGIVYFDGIVRVGDFYPLLDGGRRFENDQSMIVSTTDRSTVLQEVQYQTSCSNNLELKNRFGASQLVGFFNEAQGNVTCFSEFDVSLNLELPSVSSGQSVELVELKVDTNFAGAIDLSRQVAGQVATPGGSVLVSLGGQFDLSSRRTYTFLYSFQGISRPSGVICRGSGVLTFEAGQPLPPGVPTPLPTVPSSISPAPSPDRTATSCSLRALVVCEVIREGRLQGPCDTIQDPAMAVCSDGDRPSMLSFIYRATDGAPQNAIITVEGLNDMQSFQIVHGQTFTAEMQFHNEAYVTVRDFDDYEIDTRCNRRSDVALGNTFGPLELVGYENGLGIFTSIFEIRNTYQVFTGELDAILESASVTSAFQSAPITIPDQVIILRRNSKTTVYQETTTIDVTDKFSRGVQLDFSMDVSARTAFNGMPCNATDSYSF